MSRINKIRKNGKPPGSVFDNHGRWYWRIKLPGQDKRTTHALIPPGATRALPRARGKAVAEQLAWRLWEKFAGQSQPDEAEIVTIADMVAAYHARNQTYYRRADGTLTGEAVNCEIALRSLVELHGRKHPDDITLRELSKLRDSMIGDGTEENPGLSRGVINQRVGHFKRLYNWAVGQGFCNEMTAAAVSLLKPLPGGGRTLAREPEPVRPVALDVVKRTLSFMPPILQAMVLVQYYGDMRPGEIRIMRPGDIDMTKRIWIYRPHWFKSKHHKKKRNIYLGPQAQDALRPYLTGDPSAYIFQPALAQAERFEKLRTERKTPVQPSQISRAKDDVKKGPGDVYTTTHYRQAVQYAITACRKAQRAKAKAEGRKVKKTELLENWTPNQLRHAFASLVTREMGKDAGRIALGHTPGSTATHTYTHEARDEIDAAVAKQIAKKFG